MDIGDKLLIPINAQRPNVYYLYRLNKSFQNPFIQKTTGQEVWAKQLITNKAHTQHIYYLYLLNKNLQNLFIQKTTPMKIGAKWLILIMLKSHVAYSTSINRTSKIFHPENHLTRDLGQVANYLLLRIVFYAQVPILLFSIHQVAFHKASMNQLP